MRAIVRFVAVAAMMFALAPDTAAAQRWTWDLSLHGGYSMWTNMSDQDQSGVEEISFDHGPLGAVQLGWWGSRFGLRGNVAYESRDVLMGMGDDSDKVEVQGPVDLWSGSLDALFRFRQPNESWMGSEFLPYLALGVGARWVNPPGDDDTAVCADAEENKTWACALLNTGAGNPSIAIGEQKGLMGHIGLGADWRLSPRFALRLEAFDKISKPQLYLAGASTGTAPVQINLPNGDELVSKWAHELGASVGLNFLFGLREVAPVVVVTPPAQPTPPPAQPTPPAPQTESVTVCVIDPSATGGIRMQTATYRVNTRDTVVMVNGTATPIRQSVGNVMVARDAGWVVRGEPLNLTVGNETIRFLPYQGINRISANDIVYLGNINGYPVYANRTDVADVVASINTARGTRTDAELGTLLVDNRAARDVVQGVPFLYVPADPYGCTFQPIQPQQDVRKGGK